MSKTTTRRDANTRSNRSDDAEFFRPKKTRHVEEKRQNNHNWVDEADDFDDFDEYDFEDNDLYE